MSVAFSALIEFNSHARNVRENLPFDTHTSQTFNFWATNFWEIDRAKIGCTTEVNLERPLALNSGDPSINPSLCERGQLNK